jgi:hypothetical protein
MPTPSNISFNDDAALIIEFSIHFHFCCVQLDLCAFFANFLCSVGAQGLRWGITLEH